MEFGEVLCGESECRDFSTYGLNSQKFGTSDVSMYVGDRLYSLPRDLNVGCE